MCIDLYFDHNSFFYLMKNSTLWWFCIYAPLWYHCSGRTRTCCRFFHMTGANLKMALNASIQTEMHFFSREKCESSCCGLRSVIGRFLHRNVCSYKAEFTMGDSNVCKMSLGAWRGTKSWRFSSLENVALDFGWQRAKIASELLDDQQQHCVHEGSLPETSESLLTVADFFVKNFSVSTIRGYNWHRPENENFIFFLFQSCIVSESAWPLNSD